MALAPENSNFRSVPFGKFSVRNLCGRASLPIGCSKVRIRAQEKWLPMWGVNNPNGHQLTKDGRQLAKNDVNLALSPALRCFH
ncbi:hypothetical protein TNCV_4215561 [Trichonephila clavipes]|nr:hypothetical protein TNCV_4215561 [Trichonephila clavipes]